MSKYDWHQADANEQYDDYEFVDHGRSAHRRRKPKQAKENGRTETITTDIQEMDDGIENWVPSYAAALDPLHHERQWVISSVEHFYRENIITDVTRLVKGGKEANVYACTAHPATGLDLIAAKLYRERMLRNLKNDAIYKEGRMLRDAEGKQIRSRRERTAVLNKTGFGLHLDFMMWIGTEYRTQTLLYEAGADVPKPIAHSGSTILMEFIGDEYGAAPALNEVGLDRSEAAPLFRRVMDNVRLLLDHHLIHGDLSAYNILYWDGDIWLIDFPQVVDARANPHAPELLRRDVTRVCEYFARYGVESDPLQLTLDMWRPYMRESV
ncbi:MAG: hypothetical protein KC441_14755 [Anaerolineales bacterium]|nr:hypothetical protein [Anaerolineales bacterium]